MDVNNVLKNDKMIFKTKKIATEQKLRGGYYTPVLVAEFLTNWLLEKGSRNILEPSCGDGVFALSCQNWTEQHKVNARLTAVEINQAEIQKAIARLQKTKGNMSISWINEDFFNFYDYSRPRSFDGVIGNPPFLRFQYFENESREKAFSHLRLAGYNPTKLANAWASFVQLSIELLGEGGHLAMVLPAELLQVKYAQELRERITSVFKNVTLITFKNLVFPEIQQEVVLLLAESRCTISDNKGQLNIIDLKNETELSLNIFDASVTQSEVRHFHSGMKWTSFYLNNADFQTLSRISQDNRIPKLGQLASVDVGIVTGRNSFFVVTDEIVKQFDLQDFILPVVARTAAIKGIRFMKDLSFCSSCSSGNGNTHLLSLSNIPEEKFTEGLRRYLSLGKEQAVHIGYKCSKRKRWFDVPSVYISHGFLHRQIHKNPLLVVNQADAVCTDTIHRFKLLNGDSAIKISSAFVNSLTFASAEVYGRSYGGGVLELEPGEAEKLTIPYHHDMELDVEYIDKMLKNQKVEDALDYVDQETLIKNLGYTTQDTRRLRNAWKVLSTRRLLRT